MMALGRAHGIAGASVLLLHACSAPADLPEDGMVRLAAALGGSHVSFASRQYEVDGIALTKLKADVAVPQGYVATADEAHGSRVTQARPGVWQAEALRLDRVAIAPNDDPDNPRLTAGLLNLTPLRIDGNHAPWRTLEAGDVALLDADGAIRLSVTKVDASWEPLGDEGEIRTVVSLEGITPRPSWLSSLGLNPCLGEALVSAAPLQVSAVVSYRPGNGRLAVENLTLSGSKGTLATNAIFEAVPAGMVTGAGLANLAADWDDLAPEALFKGLAVDYVDSGAVAACLAATPSAGTAVDDLSKATSGLPVLSDEGDRAGFSQALARFAAAPGRLRLRLNPVGQIPLRNLWSYATSEARGWYLEATLAVNDEAPVESVRRAAQQDVGVPR